MNSLQHLKTIALAGAVALGVSTAASAQDYNYYAPNYDAGPTDEVTVVGPHYRPQRSAIGAPIETVALQQPVRFDDLNLRTYRGVRILRARVRDTAQTLCRRLDQKYPITADDSPSCYREAVSDAMEQANDAIASARAYND